MKKTILGILTLGGILIFWRRRTTKIHFDEYMSQEWLASHTREHGKQ